MKIRRIRRLLEGLFRRNPFPRVGRRSVIDPSAQFIGSEFIEIGHRSIIGEGCWFNVNNRTGSEPRIVIGDHTIISRRVFMSSGRKIVIGPYCLIGNESNFLGADHDFSDPFVPYLAAPAINQEDIRLGANCWTGSSCTFLKGISVGHGSVIGAGSVVTKSIPPLSVAVGSPARVLKRYRMSSACWVPVAEWTDDDERAVPDEEEYLRRLRHTHPWVPMPHVIAGHRRGNI